MYSSAVVVSLHKEREGVMVQCYRDVDYIVIIPHHHSCIINIIPCIIITIIPYIMHRYVGDVSEALHYFSKALQCDSKVPFVQVYTHRGLMLYSAGSPFAAR